MNLELIKACIATLNAEIYKADPNSEGLENLRKTLLFQVHYIEQRQCQLEGVA